MAQAHASEHGDSHGPAHYTKILVILMVLAFVSYLGPMIGIQALTLATAFGIAVVKAFLVIKHFMHLTVEKRYVGYLLLTALAFMGLFFAGVSADVMNHRGRNWENVKAQEAVRDALTLEADSHHGAGHAGHGSGHEAGGEHGAAHH